MYALNKWLHAYDKREKPKTCTSPSVQCGRVVGVRTGLVDTPFWDLEEIVWLGTPVKAVLEESQVVVYTGHHLQVKKNDVMFSSGTLKNKFSQMTARHANAVLFPFIFFLLRRTSLMISVVLTSGLATGIRDVLRIPCGLRECSDFFIIISDKLYTTTQMNLLFPEAFISKITDYPRELGIYDTI